MQTPRQFTRTMKYLIFFLVINLSTLYSQEQWFPTKYDSITKKMVADTSGAFPVSFIKLDIHYEYYRAAMYGHHTNYETKLTMTKINLYSHGLTIPINPADSTYSDYAKASYFFKKTGKNTGELTIKRTTKKETIKFIKSTRPYRNINAKWG